MLKNPKAKTIAKYALILIYALSLVMFLFLEYYFRYYSKMDPFRVYLTGEYAVKDFWYYLYTALLSTYALVWLRTKHIIYKFFITALILSNLTTILYLGLTYNFETLDLDGKTVPLEGPSIYRELYLIFGLLFHADFLRRVWRKAAISNSK